MSSKKSSENVRVVVRCRPLNKKEIEGKHDSVIDMNTKRGDIVVKKPGASDPPKNFAFDAVYDWNSKQKDLYDESFHPLVASVLEGFNGTIFAYGQTGTGKTYTMEGVRSIEDEKGVIPRSFDHIFTHIARSENQQYLVRGSYLEIYQEEIRDLLGKDQSRHYELKEHPEKGIYVKDLSTFVTKSIKETDRVMTEGHKNRSTGATNMNEHSSRSHAIFIITIECSWPGADGEDHIRVGKLNMVDLAGSERQTKTGATGDRLEEAKKINLSLSALGNVISALVDGKSTHIPYRDSKLTRLLQDSLGGNSKTVMVATVSPASYNFEETMSTLRYADRAKQIKNKPKINEDPKDALLRQFQDELERLKSQLEAAGAGGSIKRRRRKGKKGRSGGGEGGDDDDDDDGGADGDDPEAEQSYVQEQQARLEEEKQRIMNDKSMISEQKQRMLREISDRKKKLEEERQAQEELRKQIDAMESKLLVGGKNIVDHTNEQQRQLETKRQLLLEQQKKEREIQQKLEHEEESAVQVKESFQSLAQEVEVKTKRLKKLYQKYLSLKQETEDVKEEHVRKRQELEQVIEELVKDNKRNQLVIESFVPPEEKDRVTRRAEYDEERDDYILLPLGTEGTAPLEGRPTSALGNRRPVSRWSKREAMRSANPRFRGENIVILELELPIRTTRDYEAPDIAPGIQATLEQALRGEDDIEIEIPDSMNVPSKSRGKSSKKSSKRS